MPCIKGFCLLFILTAWVNLSEGVTSGSLIPCRRSDPKLSECLKSLGPAYFASFTKLHTRFRKVNIRDPQKVGKIESRTGDTNVGLNLKLTDVLAYGQSKQVVKSLKIDLKKRELNATIFCPKHELLSNYEMSGKVLLLPISGRGRSNITSVDMTIDLRLTWDIVKPNGTEYVKPRTFNYKLSPRKTYIHFENLFNGDKYLGAQMNQFMNENYKELNRNFLPVFEKVLAQQDKKELEDVMKEVSYDELFLD